MRSGVVQAAPADLGLLLSMRSGPSVPAQPLPARRAVDRSDRRPPPLLLVAGAAGVGRRDVRSALLDGPTEVGPVAPDWRVYHRSDQLPNRYGGTTVPAPAGRGGADAAPAGGGADAAPAGGGADAAAAGGGADAAAPAGGARAREARRVLRPARRVDLACAARLLDRLTVVEAPALDPRSSSVADLILDVAADAAGVLYVVEVSAALQPAEVELLAGVAQRGVPCAFILAGGDRRQRWRAVVAANRTILRSRSGALAEAPWFCLTGDPAGDAGLHGLLGEWAAGANEAAAGGIGPVPQAVTVSGDADAWPAVIEQELRSRRLAAAERVAIDLAAVHVRCMQELGSGLGGAAMPGVLDRELHALSVRVSSQLARDADRAIELLGRSLLGDGWRDGEPARAVARRIASVARRTLDSLDDLEPDRTLLLTATCGVAVVTGRAALDALFAVSLSQRPEQVVAPVGVALTANCHAMWRGRQPGPGGPGGPGGDKAACRSWLRQAVAAMEKELVCEVERRYTDLHRALSIIAGDAVDHGLLLA